MLMRLRASVSLFVMIKFTSSSEPQYVVLSNLKDNLWAIFVGGGGGGGGEVEGGGCIN